MQTFNICNIYLQLYIYFVNLHYDKFGKTYIEIVVEQ